MRLKNICGIFTRVFLLLFPMTAFSAQSNWEINVLKIHGSNTIGEKFAPDLAKKFLRAKGFRASQINHQQLPSSVDQIITAVDNKRRKSIKIELSAHGTSTGFKDLQSYSTHIAMASRRIKLTEAEKLSELYPSISTQAAENIVAYDALAILVHPDNPLSSISTKQLAGLFSGQIENWQKLGGDNAPVSIYARDNQSGTYDTFNNLVLKKYDAKLASSAKRFESSKMLSDSVAKDIYGIGFVGISHVRKSKVLAVASVNGTTGIVPGKFSIGTEDYPLSRKLFMYLPKEINQPLAKDFLDFALSNKGQSLAKHADLISFFPTTRRPTFKGLSLTRPYANLATLGERLSVVLRFKKDQFDANSKRDLSRIVRYSKSNPKRRIVLAGFWDDPNQNTPSKKASQKWLDMATKELASFEIYPWKVDGGFLPIENNAFAIGRALNRRIEVWVL